MRRVPRSEAASEMASLRATDYDSDEHQQQRGWPHSHGERRNRAYCEGQSEGSEGRRGSLGCHQCLQSIDGNGDDEIYKDPPPRRSTAVVLDEFAKGGEHFVSEVVAEPARVQAHERGVQPLIRRHVTQVSAGGWRGCAPREPQADPTPPDTPSVRAASTGSTAGGDRQDRQVAA